MGGLRRSVRVTGGILGGPWESLGGSLGVFGRTWGSPRGHQKRKLFSGGALGWSWEALGRCFDVLGDPWVIPEGEDVAISLV